ncbi:MAG: response regulator [Candidatus Doudnabacteria bacterium]|nr:response regulator [Candidatus Doudnabacteria bacterium]
MIKKQKKILVAEDEKPLAKALSLKLTKMGFLVSSVFNGAEALKTLQKEKFDFILLDLIMPEKDGFKVLTELQAKKNTTPVAVLSNLGQEEDTKRAKSLGAVAYFVKSDTPIQDIVNFVQQQLDL